VRVVAMNEPAVAESLAREAFDAVTLDMQHGAVDFAGAMRSILTVAIAANRPRPCEDASSPSQSVRARAPACVQA